MSPAVLYALAEIITEDINATNGSPDFSSSEKIFKWVLRAFARAMMPQVQNLFSGEGSVQKNFQKYFAQYEDFGYLAYDYYKDFDEKALRQMIIGAILKQTYDINSENFVKRIHSIIEAVKQIGGTHLGPLHYGTRLDPWGAEFDHNDGAGAFDYSRAVCDQLIGGQSQKNTECRAKDSSVLLENGVLHEFNKKIKIR